MKYLSNAFSLNMLDHELHAMSFGVDAKDVPVEAKSIVGHSDVAKLIGEALGRDVPANRESVTLQQGDSLFVGQYRGPRLPEGTTVLPEGSTIEFWRVEVMSNPVQACPYCAC